MTELEERDEGPLDALNSGVGRCHLRGRLGGKCASRQFKEHVDRRAGRSPMRPVLFIPSAMMLYSIVRDLLETHDVAVPRIPGDSYSVHA